MWCSAVETKGPSHVPERMAFNLPWEMTVSVCCAGLQRGERLPLKQSNLFCYCSAFQSSVILRRAFRVFSVTLEPLGKPHARQPCWKAWSGHQVSPCCRSFFLSVIQSCLLITFITISMRNILIPPEQILFLGDPSLAKLSPSASPIGGNNLWTTLAL